MIFTVAEPTYGQQLLLKTETFDANPGWDGRNNRATDPGPRQIVQNFGFSSSANAGGPAGEIGGFITPAGEPAFYGKVIAPASFNDPLSASGILNVPQGDGHTLIGFFNTNTVNEWRTPNTIALRIYGRGTYFLAYLEARIGSTGCESCPECRGRSHHSFFILEISGARELRIFVQVRSGGAQIPGGCRLGRPCLFPSVSIHSFA
jgi:hypothetical protein